jgi:hypothetical protein
MVDKGMYVENVLYFLPLLWHSWWHLNSDEPQAVRGAHLPLLGCPGTLCKRCGMALSLAQDLVIQGKARQGKKPTPLKLSLREAVLFYVGHSAQPGLSNCGPSKACTHHEIVGHCSIIAPERCPRSHLQQGRETSRIITAVLLSSAHPDELHCSLACRKQIQLNHQFLPLTKSCLNPLSKRG